MKRDFKPLTTGDITLIMEVSEDNAKQIAADIDNAVTKALYQIGMKAEGYAMQACPVDTGRLRNSIVYQIDTAESAVYIGTNVPYAEYVEMGTHKTAAQPFLRPAANNHMTQYQGILRKCLQSG